MATPCATCEHSQVREINHRIREDRPLTDISRWLGELGTPITRQALARHAKAHVGKEPLRGKRPVSADFLESVRDKAHDGLESGELTVTLKDGLTAQKQLDARAARNADMDLMLRIAITLGGKRERLPAPEVEAIEAEFRPLLTSGD